MHRCGSQWTVSKGLYGDLNRERMGTLGELRRIDGGCRGQRACIECLEKMLLQIGTNPGDTLMAGKLPLGDLAVCTLCESHTRGDRIPNRRGAFGGDFSGGFSGGFGPRGPLGARCAAGRCLDRFEIAGLTAG